jgi:hypothetical protein
MRRGRRQLLLIASLFIVPLVTAAILYYSSSWRPAVGAHGELVSPPRTLAVSGLALPDGRPAPADVFRGHWSLVHDSGAGCDERTRALLDELGRVRLALDKDAERVRRVLLHAGSCEAAGRLSRDADLLVLAAAGPAGEAFRAQFPRAFGDGLGIYIVDPHGNLIMSYPAAGSARGLLKDLERLLRLSSIG